MNFFRVLVVGYKQCTLGETARALLPILVVYATKFFIDSGISPISIESNSVQLSLIYWWLRVAFIGSLLSAVLSFWLKGRGIDASKDSL